MVYYPDLSLYDYDYYSTPEGMTIGWLMKGHEFQQGEVELEDLERLSDLGYLYEGQSRGYHYCTFCGKMELQYAWSQRFDSKYSLGSAEIRVRSDDGTLYVAPNLITHYILEHEYMPPAEFLQAVREDVRRRWPAEAG
jgi:hypothetical protein